MNDLIYTLLISVTPWIEIRGAIPYAILKAGMDPVYVFPLAVAANIFVIYPSFLLLDYVFELMKRTPLNMFINRTHIKAKPYVEKYGLWGLCFFVSIPFPGTGAYSGALAAHIFGIKNKRAMLAIACGVFIAGVLVTLITLFFNESLGFLLKSL